MTGPNSRQPPWEGEQNREAPSFGSWLRSQRKIREVPLNEIADATKISIRYLEALEQDRFDVLPASVFAKGFLREYAKFVGLDPDEVVNSYITALQAADHPEETDAMDPPTRPPREGKNTVLLVAALLAALALIAFLIYWGGRRDQGEQPSPAIAAPVLPPRPTLPVEVAQADPVPLLVTMDFTEDCWVEAAVDGRRRISELHVQGESMRFEAETEVRLTLGNPGGVRIEVNGNTYPVPETDGEMEQEIVIRLDGLETESGAR